MFSKNAMRDLRPASAASMNLRSAAAKSFAAEDVAMHQI